MTVPLGGVLHASWRPAGAGACQQWALIRCAHYILLLQSAGWGTNYALQVCGRFLSDVGGQAGKGKDKGAALLSYPIGRQPFCTG